MPALATHLRRFAMTPKSNLLRQIIRILPQSSRCLNSLPRFISTSQPPNYEDFYRYTSGRWLWDESARLLERYKRFDVPALKQIAANAAGAQTCVSISKLTEGGSNKVFRLVMDNGAVVIARIRNPNAGLPVKTTASEVATMEFARTVLDIPVPKVLAWSAQASNPVESEYILMEEAVGTQLGEVWYKMDFVDKLKIVDEIVELKKKMLALSFTRYGNLYFPEDAFPGCEKAEAVGSLPQALKDAVGKRFVVGPVADRDFWHKERASMDIDRGPWKTASEYLKAIAQREMTWLNNHATLKPPDGMFGSSNRMFGISASEAQRSPEAHIALYKQFADVVEHLLPEGNQIRPTLWHWDIHAPNLFVRNNRITSIVDWQNAWTGPLFLQAKQPGLVRYYGEMLLEAPEGYDSLEDGDEKTRIRNQIERSLIRAKYELETENTNPIIHDISLVPHAQVIRETVAFSSNTWDDDILPFRQCLIRVARHWDDINPNIPCPIAFTPDDIDAHLRDGEGWNDTADFWDALQGIVQRDGWTSIEDYEDALEMFAEAREKTLEGLSGEEKVAFEEVTSWAVRKTD